MTRILVLTLSFMGILSGKDWVEKPASGIWLGRHGRRHVARNNYILNTRFGIDLSAPEPKVEAPGPAEEDALAPWAANTHPTDVARSHAEEVTAGAHEYTVVQGGTMDGESCRTPMGVGMNSEGAFFQTWESNRLVRLENIGETDVINPWLSNGRNNFRSAAEIVASATRPDMTDGEKAFALWFQQIRYRHHSPGDNLELGDPVKVFNVYGHNTCGNDSICLGALWRAAGIRGAAARALGHCISQAYYDGGWHLFDGDLHSLYLLRDNVTVASDVHLANDHDLVKRTHSKGILMLDTDWDAPGVAALYCTETQITAERSGRVDTTMDMVLRPGEALVWRWGQTSPVKYHGTLGAMPAYPHTICSGLWEYRPDLTKQTWRKGAAQVGRIVSGPKGLTAEAGGTESIVWKMKSPYVFVGGRIEAVGRGARFSIRRDGKAWLPVTGSMDRHFPAVGPACYEYEVRCEVERDAALERVAILNDVQMAPRALPEMRVGGNVFTYTDESTEPQKVRITHRWVERSATRPPAAPEVVYPPDGGESDGTDIVFGWKATDPDGDELSDYHFELSRYADMRHPLSMDFYKLSSRTMDAPRVREGHTWKAASVKPQYTLQGPGLLTPGTTYYWHVRAMDEAGVWGPWSRTWRFTAQGPGVPAEVRVVFDEAREVGHLKWKPATQGREAVKYLVYGSDEKGFTASDRRRQLPLGVTKKEMAAWDPWAPDNFIGETAETEMAVIGSGVDNPKANKTYYRVVAVDAKGKRSGPSDYATAPRPVIHTRPVTKARVGTAYTCEVAANRSLGSYTSRGEGAGYHDIEYPKYALEKGPAWLKIDSSTGALLGTPAMPGTFEVEVSATIDRKVRRLDELKLIWGHEKVISEGIERVGVATQRFVIEVE